MYIHVILQSWPEYVLEKFLAGYDAGSSYKSKLKPGTDGTKRRPGNSKGRTGKESKFGAKTTDGAQTFEDFFSVALEDHSPD